MNFNKVILAGRLTRDPEQRALPSGQSVVSFGLATDRFYIDKTGQKQREADFHNIVVFGKLSEIAFQYLKKGSLVLIEGRIRTRKWVDNDEITRYRTEIITERLQLGPKSAQQTTSYQDQGQKIVKEEIPVIEEEEINVKDLPF